MKLRKKPDNKPIYVTKPTLASIDEFSKELKSVWDSGILTHNGPKVKLLERELSNFLGTERFVSASNGTIALQMAIKALDLKGEIITSAFTWIATVSAIKWENCKPVFCDINPETLNIDADKIKSKITSETVAIMPVHVFGNPCDVDQIQNVADEHNLKVIYDAAHSIGSTYNSKSLLSYGDISATSLHATKILNSGEGGGCVTNDKELASKIRRIRFFGHNSSNTEIVEDGFNGKMTEIHASLGLINLKKIDLILTDRKRKCELYENLLSINKKIQFQDVNRKDSNNSYFPIKCDSEKHLLKIEEVLNKNHIFPRRYFYPSANTFNHIVNYEPCPISEDVAKRILCLPLYFSLETSDIVAICQLINEIK